MIERKTDYGIAEQHDALKVVVSPPFGRRVVLVDRSGMTRECLANLLIGHRIEVEAVDRAPDVIAADLVLVHIGPSRIDEPRVEELMASLRERCGAGSALAVISDRPDLALALAAVRLGLRGYLPTSLSAKTVAAAVELILSGGSFIPAPLAPLATITIGPKPILDRRRRETITERENEVLAALKEGQPNKIIAHGLRISEHTVKVHVRNIMKKLRATNRTQLAAIARRMTIADDGAANA